MTKAKKILLSGITCVFLSISIYSCAEKAEREKDGAVEVPAPAQIIPVAQAKDMYENYTKRRARLIWQYEDSINVHVKKSTDTFNVARYTYYDYATIKQYMAFIEQEAKKANVEISSLRFYFSNYPDNPKFENGDPIKHPRQNSIFILPTLKKGGDEFGFYTAKSELGKIIPVLLSNDLKTYNPTNFGNTKNGDFKSYAGFIAPSAAAGTANPNSQSLILNRGNGIPPPWQ